MAYDEQLADRVRAALGGAQERRMFGGLAFLVDGYLAVAVSGQGGLMLRVDPAQSAALVAQPHVERVVMQGREMAGWLHVAAQALTGGDALQAWLDRATGCVGALPERRP